MKALGNNSYLFSEKELSTVRKELLDFKESSPNNMSEKWEELGILEYKHIYSYYENSFVYKCFFDSEENAVKFILKYC